MVEQKKLAEQKYWETVYEPPVHGTFSITKKTGDFLKKIFGSRIKNYSEYILWSNFYEKYLPKNKGLKILEIGSAPGWNLIKFKNVFGYEPYGIEYTHLGAEENRRQFKEANINPENLIEADFFDSNLNKKFEKAFDLVESGGFIEHYTDVPPVIKRHLQFLKPGGTLIIIIPNFRGLNRILFSFFNPEMLKRHNLDVMKIENFRKLFEGLPVESKYANYYGTFNFGLFNTKNIGTKYYIHRFLVRFQVLLNIIFIFVFGNKGFEFRYFSPYLIYIGQKR